MKLNKTVAWLAAAALVALLAACGGGDDDDETGGATTAPAIATEDGGEGGGGGAVFAAVAMEASDFKFTPQDLTVELTNGETGLQITYENVGEAPHTFTVYKDKEYKDQVEHGTTSLDGLAIQDLIVLDTSTGQVERGTTYYFRCEIHPDQMQGTLRME